MGGGNVTVSLKSDNPAVTVPASVVANTTGTFPITTAAVTTTTTVTVTATYFGSKSATLTVNPARPVLTSIVVSPASVTLTTGRTQAFTATAKDQFGTALAMQPAFTWTATGVGTVTSAGVYSAGATAGSATVKATSGTVSGTAAVTVNPASAGVNDLSVYSTGSGKITLYWTAVANATGYNIYRGTAAGGQNYTQPINGSTPVNAASYSGSPMNMFSDTGLTDGREYFYTVTAVYSSGQSQPSNEDRDIPDPVDVPWDTRNSGAILSVIRSDFSDDTNSIGTDPFSLRARWS